ncbi:MAG: IS3 family transposase, partial [Bdellovibrionaceae bacterium]|nr:IS3 family transposase [Pseudobdellovibrionaceae bacterium]
MDLFSRKIIGWSISKRIDTDLTLQALRMAIRKRKPKKGVIHHLDRGVQYLSEEYVSELKKNGFIVSNSEKGNPYDNAFMERFMRILKQQEVYLAQYETYLDVMDQLPLFIENVYNEKRVHSSIDYLTPNELEEMEKSNKNMSRF